MRGDVVYNLIPRLMCTAEASSSYPWAYDAYATASVVVHLDIVPPESANLTTFLVAHHEELDHADEDVEEVKLEAMNVLVTDSGDSK